MKKNEKEKEKTRHKMGKYEDNMRKQRKIRKK